MSVRRLPVYILLDTSGSMKGEPIESVNVGMHSLLDALRQDPYALECVHICVITFDTQAQVHMPLTPLESVQFSDLEIPESGATMLGEALFLLIQQVEYDLIETSSETKGDWRPLMFLMTDGSPSDVHAYENAIVELQRCEFAAKVACAAGPKAKPKILQKLTHQVYSMDIMDSATFAGFFQWVSTSVSIGNSLMGTQGNIKFPPPPEEIQVVL